MNRRLFKNEKTDTGAVHSIGNGNILVYQNGPNIASVLGPYTSAMHFSLKVKEDENVWETKREKHTDFYTHINGQEETVMEDYCHQDYPCFIREIKSENGHTFFLHVPGNSESYENPLFEKDGYLCITYYVKGGNPIVFHTSHTPFTGFFLVSKNGARIKKTDGNCWEITTPPGKTNILACGTSEYTTVISGLRTILSSDLFEIKKERRNFWMEYASRRDTENEPDYVDAALISIKTQQSVQGALPSCFGLPYGFSRDNYGASRGYLALGYHEDARKILDFRFDKWQTFGTLRNAEGMGCFEPRHFSENEEVEQTSYTLLSARDYHLKTKDSTYIHKIFPMLMWCANVQVPHIHKGMLPFNGDETYIAGGLLPRSAVNQGAAQATLMFAEGASWLIEWAVKNGKTREIFGLEKHVSGIKSKYRDNFVKDGKYIANNPDRIDNSLNCLPANRGVCAQADYLNKSGGFSEDLFIGQLLYDGKGHFVRDLEIATGGFKGEEQKRKILGEVLVSPAFLGNDILTKENMGKFAEDFMEMDRKNLVVAGHEPAMLLYTLCVTGADKEKVKRARDWVLEFMNENGSWDEYYVNNETKTVRHRPWETGYSLEALLLSEKMLQK